MDLPPFDHVRLLTKGWQDGPPRHDLGGSAYAPPAWRERGLPPVDLTTNLTLDAGPEQALQATLAKRHGVAPEQVLVTAGTTAANTALILALLRGGDHVVCERPYYQALPGLARGLPAEVTYVDRDPAQDWRLDAEAVAAACTPRTRLILLTSPNNPTGAAASRDDLVRLGNVAEAHDAHVLVDQVFQELTDHPMAANLHPRLVTTSGLSKRWGVPGLRIGWLIGAEGVVARARQAHLYTALAPAPPSAAAAGILLAHEDACRAGLAAHLTATHAIYAAWAAKHGHPAPAPGSLTAFPPVPVTMDDAGPLLRDHGILVLPGDAFGTPGHIRVGLGGDPEALQAALAALDIALAAIKD